MSLTPCLFSIPGDEVGEALPAAVPDPVKTLPSSSKPRAKKAKASKNTKPSKGPPKGKPKSFKGKGKPKGKGGKRA
jgi:hypothetical protein